MQNNSLPSPTIPEPVVKDVPLQEGTSISPSANIGASSISPNTTLSNPAPADPNLSANTTPPSSEPASVPMAQSRLASNNYVPAGLAQEAPGGSAPVFDAGKNLASTPRMAPLGGINNSLPMAPPPPPPAVFPAKADIQEKPGLGNSGSGSSPKIIEKKSFLDGIKSNPKKFILIFMAGLTALAFLALIASGLFGGKKTNSVNNSASVTNNAQNPSTSTKSSQSTSAGNEVILTYWGLWEETDVLADVIKDYEAKNPGIKIDYRKQSHVDYRERLQTAVASGNGPDIFRFHASWTSMLSEELAPLPNKIMTIEDYQKIFYPIATKQLQYKGQLVGIPLMYDSLALYYNKEMLKTAGVQPPTTWAELKKMANDLSVPSSKTERGAGNIQRSGLAIGNASNVEHFADILALLILQNGGSPNQPNSPEVSDALVFYTNFVKADKVWNDTLPSSTVAFARGDAAMMFAPSWRAHEIKAMNPELDFGITTVPRLGDEVVTWSSYWAEGVNSKSKNKDQAWEFLKYMSSKEVLQKLYSSASKIRAFGEIYPRQDMASELMSDELVAPFLTDAPKGRGWHMNSYTHDNGANDLTIKYYEDAVNAILEGKQAKDVLETLEQGVFQVMRQYGEISE